MCKRNSMPQTSLTIAVAASSGMAHDLDAVLVRITATT